MDETFSDLTKISVIPKRQRVQVEDSLQITSRTIDKSFTEISDVSELSVSKPPRTLVTTYNKNNENEDKSNVSTTTSLEEKSSEIHGRVTILDPGIQCFVTFEAEDETPGTQIDGGMKRLLKVESGRDDTEYVSRTDQNEIMTLMIKTSMENNENKPSESLPLKADKRTSEFFNTDIDSISTKSMILPISMEIEVDKEHENIKKETLENQRELMINNLNLAMNEKIILTNFNDYLNSKIAEYFRQRRPDASSKMKLQLQQKESMILDKDERYKKYLQTVICLQNEIKVRLSETEKIHKLKLQQIEDQKIIMEETKEEFISFRQKIGFTAANGNTGRRIPAQDLEAFCSSENAKENIVQTVRLENIKLQNKVSKLQMSLVAKESLTNKLNLVDFEQYKIENQSYNGKLEERNDSICRLNSKIGTNIHIITHMKEKLQSILKESETENHKLQEIAKKFDIARRKYTKLKNSRDDMLVLNTKLLKSGGLLRNKKLLHHFQFASDENKILRGRVNGQKTDFDLLITEDKNVLKNLKKIIPVQT